MGLDLFFPKQMQENLKVSGQGAQKDPFVLVPRTRAKGIGLGNTRDTSRISVSLWATWT